MKYVFVAGLLLAPLIVSANSNCDKPRNDFDGLYCLNKVYIEADKELNENYGKLRGLLDDAGKKRCAAGSCVGWNSATASALAVKEAAFLSTSTARPTRL
jgi:uncharacterized protein YecT (DUF1311 family)